MTVESNPYLAGNFAPIHAEATVDRLPVMGEIPPELNGMFVRNGPNPQFPPIGRYHWFDGDGMLHGVQLKNGTASYRNRYIRTKGFQVEREAGRAIWGGVVEPTTPNPHGAFKNVANTALVWHNDRLFALWEGGEPHEIAVPTLETIAPYTFEGKLHSAVTAHPKVDPVTGEMMFFGYSLFQPPYVQYSVVSPQGELLRTVPIDLPVGVMMHDFAVTEHYTIFMDLPLTFRVEKLQRGEPAFTFESDRPSRFGILPRHGDNSTVRWFESPSCYVFHTLNAFESEDEVILIACRTSSTNVLGATPGAHEGDNPQVEDNRPFLYRWRFNLKTGTVQEERLDDRSGEFPRINEQYLGRNTRYGYLAKSADGSMPRFDGLIKYDLATGVTQVHEFGAACYGGECVFAPRPGASDEDDGWLITFVYDELQGSSELVVIDGQDVEAAAIARIPLPQRVPYGFHGSWIPQ